MKFVSVKYGLNFLVIGLECWLVNNDSFLIFIIWHIVVRWCFDKNTTKFDNKFDIKLKAIKQSYDSPIIITWVFLLKYSTLKLLQSLFTVSKLTSKFAQNSSQTHHKTHHRTHSRTRLKTRIKFVSKLTTKFTIELTAKLASKLALNLSQNSPHNSPYDLHGPWC